MDYEHTSTENGQAEATEAERITDQVKPKTARRRREWVYKSQYDFLEMKYRIAVLAAAAGWTLLIFVIFAR